MSFTLNHNIKHFSQYSDNIPIANGVEIQMSQLDMSKWTHFPPRDKFTFQLLCQGEQLFMTVLANDRQPLEQINVSKQDIQLKRISHIQFSIKSPSISCKYMKLSNNVVVQRRFQMTLEKEQDFNTLVHVFTQLKFVVKNAKVLRENTNNAAFLSSQVSQMPLPNQNPFPMGTHIGKGVRHDQEPNANTNLLETQIEEPVNLNFSDNSSFKNDSLYSNMTIYNNQSPTQNETNDNNISISSTKTIVESAPLLGNNTSYVQSLKLPQLQPQLFVKEGKASLTKPIFATQPKPYPKPKLLQTNNVGNSFPKEVDQTIQPPSVNTTTNSFENKHFTSKTQEKASQSQPAQATNESNTFTSSPTFKFEHPLKPLNNNNNCTDTTVNSPTIVTTITALEPLQQQPGNSMPTKESVTSSHYTKPKKKVHITRKLIKAKLKDKKFRKWVSRVEQELIKISGIEEL